jgi:hypothetical protein
LRAEILAFFDLRTERDILGRGAFNLLFGRHLGLRSCRVDRKCTFDGVVTERAHGNFECAMMILGGDPSEDEWGLANLARASVRSTKIFTSLFRPTQ